MFKPFGISPAFGVDDVAAASLGGLVLGITVCFKTYFTGKVCGISTITRNCIGVAKPPLQHGLSFVLGLIVAGIVMSFLYEGAFEAMPPPGVENRGLFLARLLIGGMCVGFGSATANGCTSGHGLTGLARFSLRSWCSVPTFLVAAMGIATLSGTARALPPQTSKDNTDLDIPAIATTAACTVLFLAAGCYSIGFLCRKLEILDWRAHAAIDFVVGLCFGAGLVIATMVKPSKVGSFLDLGSGVWDPSLGFVMGVALMITTPFFAMLSLRGEERAKPFLGESFKLPPRLDKIDFDLVVGSLLFGLGWGTAGACPGPVWVFVLGQPSLEGGCTWAGMILGMLAWRAVRWYRSTTIDCNAVIHLKPAPEQPTATTAAKE
eukprot:TRINITY_DN38334_c0_g1_i1.p1 TRINITY_DN38334_c0_g1~~TRINITY_DN38334_c0_g1_i1.p1  ORF type:complete len:377 (+),score=73.37 TRINITY_DN38334_c0_g1_i1:110-1240(+)